MAQIRQAVLILLLAGLLGDTVARQAPKFFPDDPIPAMPPPMPVGKPVRQNIDPVFDFLIHSKGSNPRTPVPAGGVNTLGEVPDNEWFINRHGTRRLSREALQRGSSSVEAPAVPFTIVSGKSDGIMPGFVMEDAKRRRYFVKADPMDYAELATSAEVIVSKVLYAVGYNTPKNEVVDLKLSDIRLSNKAKITLSGQRPREMTWHDVQQIFSQMPRRADGSFRIVASLALKGEVLGPFQYVGTRDDDPNDIIPHQNRRDLRGLYVFSAWLNNTDPKAGNTLDTIVEENGIRFIRHHLIDFGSALGSDGDVPKDARFGHEFMVPTLGDVLKQILSLGLVPSEWERTRFPKLPAVGNFESQSFDPDTWKPDYPNPAFLSRQPDDDFWAAKQVMSFTDDDIRAIVETARFSDHRSKEYMIATLAERRNKIGRTFFSKILPLDHFRVDNEKLLFDDLAVRYAFHPPRRYEMRWYRFDNISQKRDPIAGNESTRLPDEAFEASSGSYFSASIKADEVQLKPVSVYLRKDGSSFKVIGVDRNW